MRVSNWTISSVGVLALAVGNLVAGPTVGIPFASPTTVLVNTTTTVTVTCQISDSTLLPGGVNLLRPDPAGIAESTILGVMHDDGKNGDAVAGDKIFSLQVSLNEKQA